MIAVSNTTPLRYLVAIEQEHLLGQLFEKVLVPPGVREELTEPRAPEFVRLRVLSLSAWYELRSVQETRRRRFPFHCIEANEKPYSWQKCSPQMSS